MSEKCNTSIKAAKSVLDAINIYFEMLNMREIRSVGIMKTIGSRDLEFIIASPVLSPNSIFIMNEDNS